MKSGFQADTPAEICRANSWKMEKYKETAPSPNSYQVIAILKLNMADHMVRIRH